jgi:hypothetical protein
MGKREMKTRTLFMILAAGLSLAVADAGAPASAATVVRLPNCQYAGQSMSADLSTTTVVGSIDPHWVVSFGGNPISGAPGHTALSAWTALPNNWIQPSASSTTANQNEPAGKYTYTIRFYIPCEPKNYTSLRLDGKAAGDDEVLSIALNNTVIPGANCLTGYCFQSAHTISFGAPPPSAFVRGYNTLTVVVNNDGGPSGMAAIIRLTARCGKECCMLLEKKGLDEAAPADER